MSNFVIVITDKCQENTLWDNLLCEETSFLTQNESGLEFYIGQSMAGKIWMGYEDAKLLIKTLMGMASCIKSFP